MIQIQPHYEIGKIKTIDDLRECFPHGEADELNWCFLSTSGVHGSYTTLDDWNDKQLIKELEEYNEPFTITVLVVRPRTVVMLYGQIRIEKDDEIEFLRKLAKTTVKSVTQSQKGNL